ncbi:hypothetical protein EMIHUDRAFT_316803 [Emiliania huxleyi CCMP1516]|uniref:Uncharacterized protein n=2 Tax=Emiliania huxleyi TaxID=2903 RepID=A0A0D3IPX7_EMIH1|nr:hypothetical protein EMIHUDRAFT_316803 [Emiliania huxleyi CCMP1516]EOD13312.1 hypothetical protein EMIHUDRAFT_316803 [Emiliania huxleyi CCMP1516]|eukprot:XP_005765741.1 hypothetical protein EMIHUDRAFT_316803 [Emiliania huxleyi CCMP1516]
MRHALRVEPATGAYTPPLYVNELWSLRSGMPRLNASTGYLNLTVSLAPTSLAAVHGDEMVEEMRRMLLETNPWLLGLTMAVSLLHSLFDFLAFKNDVQFWRDNKSMKGISLNSLLLNLFIQAVILLSNGVGLLIEAWKLRKIVKSVALRWPAGSWRPRLQLTAADSYVLSDTKAHDEEAMAYLGRVIAPLAVGYASYSLLYDEHKSWYSWLLRAVVGCVYSFGFIKMTPQLFINYRLKSTAHMPWKTFMYKALNTFVDDLFAFVITMPTMHRLSCLRDDLIFVVYLYQRWAYGVDSRRANEFGQVGEEEGSEALPAPPQAPGSTAPVDADGKPKAE